MFKELKYFVFVVLIFLFLFFTAKHYFSDINKKKSYRSLNTIDQKLEIIVNQLPILKDDTKNIIEYIEQTKNKNKKKYNFWKLLEKND